jgi:hypothetical protein
MLARDANEERAFPVTIGQTDEDLQGMSLRDWFAGQALSGVWAGRESDFVKISVPTSDDVAGACYTIADAMMEARKR